MKQKISFILFGLLAMGCRSGFQDLADPAHYQVNILFSDGKTGVPDFPFTYHAIFEARRKSYSAHILKTYDGPTQIGNTSISSEFTDENGTWNYIDPNVNLWTTVNTQSCTSVCTDDDCTFTTEVCEDDTETRYFNLAQVKSVETWISYTVEGIPAHTIVSAKESYLGIDDLENPIWIEKNEFITPFERELKAPADLKPIVIRSENGAESRTEFVNRTPIALTRDQLTPAQLERVKEAIEVLKSED